jgi:hypothetical protein
MICSQRQQIRKKFGMPDNACEYENQFFFIILFLKFLGTSCSHSAAHFACLSKTNGKFDPLLASFTERAEDIE